MLPVESRSHVRELDCLLHQHHPAADPACAPRANPLFIRRHRFPPAAAAECTYGLDEPAVRAVLNNSVKNFAAVPLDSRGRGGLGAKAL